MLGQGELLSSELFWWWGDPNYIIDLHDGQRYDLINLNQMPPLEGYKFDPKYYAYFQSAEQVFILQGHNKVIALSSDFRQNPDRNVIYFLPSGSGAFGDGKNLEKLMNDLGVKYKIVDFAYPYLYDTDLLSPTGKYIVRDDGIYLSETNTVAVRHSMKYSFRGWYYDESGVVINKRGYYLIDLGPGLETSGFQYFYLPGPTIKLRLPMP